MFLKNGDLAWLAMKRPGFEADRFAIKLRHRGAVRDVAAQWDHSVSHLDVTRDGRTLLDCRTLTDAEVDEVADAVRVARG